MNIDILYTIVIVVGLFAFIQYVVPYLKSKNVNYYQEIKLALLLCGYAFRDDKIKAIAAIALSIVTKLESLSLEPVEKHEEAVARISQTLLDDFNIDIDPHTLDIIVQVAVTLLPKTN